MELKVKEYQLPEEISFNFEELKQELIAKVSMYETMVYTDDQIKEAKADKAQLNKLKKALNDERIRREKEYLVPFNTFKTQVNEIISIIDKPVAVIDQQVKAYEDKKKQDKLDEITAFFNSALHPEWLHLSQIFDEKWLNASVSMKTVQDAMNARLDQIEVDLTTLHDLPEFGFEATEVYKTTLDMNKAINEGHRLSEIQKRKAEAEAAQAKMKEDIEAFSAAMEAEKAKMKEDPEYAQSMKLPEEQHPKMWIAFKALVTVDQAMELKKFFNDRQIEIQAL